MHACSLEDAKLLQEEVKQLLPSKQLELHQIGPTIGTYCGPGTLGIIFNSKQR
jgi:fatty acid-binding protein DegV